MAEFNLSTSFNHDHELMDLVADAVWEPKNRLAGPVDGFKAQRGDIDTPEFIGLAAGLGLTPTTSAFRVWPPIAVDTEEPVEFDPQPGDTLRITDAAVGDELPAATGWIVRRFTETPVGHWAVIVESEKFDSVDAA